MLLKGRVQVAMLHNHICDYFYVGLGGIYTHIECEVHKHQKHIIIT